MGVLNRKYKLFVGSASESLFIANKIKEFLPISCKKIGLSIEVQVWDSYPEFEGKANESFMDKFNRLLDNYQFGLFVLSDDDMIFSRNNMFIGARDNVLFEAGMFVGRKGIDSVFFFMNLEDFDKNKIPSDLQGTLFNGVKWNSNIFKLHAGESSKTLYRKNYDAIPKRNKTVYHKIEKKINEEIIKYCEKISKNIKTKLQEDEKKDNYRVEYLPTRQDCFDKGKELIRSAQERIYTTISFKGSLTGNKEEEKEMHEALEEKLKESLKVDSQISFKRFFGKHDKIRQQFGEFDKLLRSSDLGENEIDKILRFFSFEALELIISDDDVLMVFPFFSGLDDKLYDKVDYGFVIENNNQLAGKISAWLFNKLTKQKD